MQFLPYILAFITLVFLVLQLYPYLKLRAVRGKIAPSLDKILNTEQRKQSQLLLYFMAPQCGMCRNITPIIEELSQQRTDVVQVDIFRDVEVARELGVMGTPAFILIKDGIIEKVKLGGLSRDKILELLS